MSLMKKTFQYSGINTTGTQPGHCVYSNWTSALIGLACAATGALVATGVNVTLFNKTIGTTIAVVDTQRVIDAQKLYWIRAMNETRPDQTSPSTHAEILKESAAFPQKLTNTLKAVAKRSNAVLLDKKSLAVDGTVPDYTEDVFKLLALDPDEAMRIEKALQSELFSAQGFSSLRR